MAHIIKRTTKTGDPRWEVAYRGPDNRQRSKRFVRRIDAQKFASTIEADMVRGDWLDPNKGMAPFAEWAERWYSTKHDLKPAVRQSYGSILTSHLVPEFGDMPVASIDHPAILAFLSEMATRRKPKTVKNSRDVLRQIMELAVRSGAIKSNPVEGTKSAKVQRKEMVFLTSDQVMDLAHAIEHPPVRRGGGEHRQDSYPDYGLLVRFAAFTGLRAGEIVALQARHVQLLRGVVEVMAAATEAYGKLDIGATKTYERRAVPMPPALRDEMAEFIAKHRPEQHVFTGPSGAPLRHSNWYPRHYKPAVIEAGLDPNTRFHDLRHTYAALLIAEGAHPRAIMERMGHSTINVTLGTYGHLFPSIDAQLNDALDAIYRSARPTTRKVIDLPLAAEE